LGVLPEFTDKWLYDASYIRVKNVTLGYTMPSNTLSKLNVASARIYLSAENLFNRTDFPGGNPEANNHSTGDSLTQGSDYGGFPLAKTYTLGVNLSF